MHRPSSLLFHPLPLHPLHPHMIYSEALHSHFPMAATNEAILLGNDTQVVDLHKEIPWQIMGMIVAITEDSVTFLLHRIVAVELNYLQGYFNDLIQSLQPYPRPTPSEEVTRVRSGVYIDPTP